MGLFDVAAGAFVGESGSDIEVSSTDRKLPRDGRERGRIF
jgi:hypothetical protein